MSSETIVAIIAGLLTIVGNAVVLAFYAGGQKQIIEAMKACIEKLEAKMDEHGASIEKTKSDVRVIAIECGATKYVQQIS